MSGSDWERGESTGELLYQVFNPKGGAVKRTTSPAPSINKPVPTTITTACGLQVTVTYSKARALGRAYGQPQEDAELQASRLYTFLRNDDHFYAPQSAVRAAGLAPVQAGWHEVESSSIRAVKWDPDRKSLTVEFISNRSRYRYDRMDEATVRAFLEADSHGRFFESRIKGHYPSTKLDE